MRKSRKKLLFLTFTNTMNIMEAAIVSDWTILEDNRCVFMRPEITHMWAHWEGYKGKWKVDEKSIEYIKEFYSTYL